MTARLFTFTYSHPKTALLAAFLVALFVPDNCTTPKR